MKTSFLTNIGLALLRIGVSLMMIFGHGLGKFQKLIAGNFEFPNPLGIGSTPSLFLAVMGEFIAPILIIIGYKTRLASIPAAITMAGVKKLCSRVTVKTNGLSLGFCEK